MRKIFFSSAVIIIIGAAFFIPFLGAVHLFDWDEINFAESAREMIVTGNYSRVQIDFQPFWEKPPLFFWLQAASMHVFGINEFAARFPNALAGIFTLLTFFLIGKKLYNQQFGIWWGLCMLGSFLPHLYFKSGIIDPVFNYFIFAGIYCLILSIEKNEKQKSWKYSLLCGLFIGLATLTKGPVGLLIVLLTFGIYWISVRLKKIISWKQIFVFGLTYLLTAGMWFLIDVADNGIGFFREFINYQVSLLTQPVAGHGGPVYFHFVIVLLGCFPMSVIALPALIKNYREKSPLDFKRWMLILFWVVMILFSIVKTKIVHYSSLTYFPLSFLCAFVIQHEAVSKKVPKWLTGMLIAMGAIFSFILAAAPWIAQHKGLLIPYIKDSFAVDCLSTPVHWNGWEPYMGVVYFLLLLVAVILLNRKEIEKGIYILFASTAFCLLVYLKAVVPKIESYSQGPAIRFYEELRGQHVYVNTIGFKSYAQFFYFRKPEIDFTGSDSSKVTGEMLLKGPLDRPAYFVLKSNSINIMDQYPDIKLLKKEGGFAFYIRMPQ